MREYNLKNFDPAVRSRNGKKAKSKSPWHLPFDIKSAQRKREAAKKIAEAEKAHS